MKKRDINIVVPSDCDTDLDCPDDGYPVEGIEIPARNHDLREHSHHDNWWEQVYDLTQAELGELEAGVDDVVGLSRSEQSIVQAGSNAVHVAGKIAKTTIDIAHIS